MPVVILPLANPGNFNGEVRRFPEFLQIPDPPIADLDTLTYPGGAVSINVMVNDLDPQGDPISVSAIVSGPTNGVASISNGQIIYTANNGVCGITDTIVYEIVDITCMCDTARIIINIPGVALFHLLLFFSNYVQGVLILQIILPTEFHMIGILVMEVLIKILLMHHILFRSQAPLELH
jgi:hypothetical protein